MMDNDRSNLKPGNRVWVGNSQWAHTGICTVTRLTAAWVIVNDGRERRFWIKSGYEVGGSSFRCDQLGSRATRKEIREWTAKQECETEAYNETKRQEEAREVTRLKLQTLFPEGIWIDAPFVDEKHFWRIGGYLTEEQVRICAAALKEKASS